MTFNWDGKRMILTKLPKPAIEKAPAKAEAVGAEVIKIVPASAEEKELGPREPLSFEGHRTCLKCDARVGEFETRCHACGADIGILEKQARIWRQMNKDPTGR